MTTVPTPEKEGPHDIGKMIAKDIRNEFVTALGAVDRLKEDAISRAYNSQKQTMDALGSIVLNLPDNVASLWIAKDGSYLDGTTVQIGDLKFTYAARPPFM